MEVRKAPRPRPMGSEADYLDAGSAIYDCNAMQHGFRCERAKGHQGRHRESYTNGARVLVHEWDRAS